MAKATLEQRFWAKVNLNGPVPPHRPELGPCWPWTGVRNHKGYGGFNVMTDRGRRPVGAHRWAWETFVGPIPLATPWVLHHCDNPACVNYANGHLWLGTAADNTADMMAKGRSKKGRVPLQPCGTAAAYQRHRKDGEKPCANCRKAWTAWKLGWRQRRRTDAG